MDTVFFQLTEAMSGAPLVALGAAFVWGLFSVLLSPCHLASIPLVIGYLQRGEAVSTRRAAALATLLALGILVSIALIGALTAAAGRLLGDLGPWTDYVVATVFFVFGLHLVGWLPMPEAWLSAAHQPRRGPLGALLFGMVFGLALGPCTFGFLAPVLGLSFGISAASTALAAGMVILFGLGQCAIIGLAGASSNWIRRWLAWRKGVAGTLWLRRVCGVLVFAAGVYLLTGTN